MWNIIDIRQHVSSCEMFPVAPFLCWSHWVLCGQYVEIDDKTSENIIVLKLFILKVCMTCDHINSENQKYNYVHRFIFNKQSIIQK